MNVEYLDTATATLTASTSNHRVLAQVGRHVPSMPRLH